MPLAQSSSKARGESKVKRWSAMGTDVAYIEAGEQQNLIVQKLQEDARPYGRFGFSYLDQNTDTLQGAIVSGTKPTFDAIADGNYSVSRALYFYVKHSHAELIPSVKLYMKEWVKHWDDEGILSDAGMLPMPKDERS